MKFARTLIRPQQTQWSILCPRTLAAVAAKPFKDMPGLSSLPVIGTLHHFLPVVGSVGIQKNVFETFSLLNKKFGPIVKWEGLPSRGTLVICFDPKDYDQVYRAEEHNPERKGFKALEYYREVLHKDRFDGVYGLTTAQGEKWKHFRSTVNPALLKIKLVQLYTPGLEKIADDSLERLLKLSPEALADEFDEEMTKWSLESVALIALGTRIGCLEDHAPDHPCQKLIYCAQSVADLAFKVEFMPTLWKTDVTKTENFKKMIEIFDVQWDLSQMFINQSKQKMQERGPVPEEDQSVLEKLLAIDDKIAIMMANEMLLAGIDTVAFALTGLLYQLAVNQKAQDKVREEIRQKKSSRYLKACLKESLRLAPVIPANLRSTTKEHIVGGYEIPIGVSVIAPNEVLSKMDEHYVRANEFLPERWVAEKSDPLYHGNAHPMVTLPFGFGVRSCIGRRIAEMEIEIFAKKIIEKRRITWNGPPLEVITKMLNSFKKPFSFKFEPLD